MSYILDALRKAEAERERGTVPGVHAQPMFAGAAQPAMPVRTRPWIALLAGAVVVLGAALLWSWFGAGSRDTPPPVTVAPAPVVPALAPTTPPPALTSAPAAVPVAVASAPAVQRKPRPAAPAAPASAAAPRTAAASSPESRVYTLNELPEDIRRQLPALAVGGSMYSATPADRILILNGLVLHEGDRVAPDLVLQQIKLKAAVLAFKGYRYSIYF